MQRCSIVLREVLLVAVLLAGYTPAQNTDAEAAPAVVARDPAKVASVRPLEPAAAIAAIELPAGYHLELVASEPMIHEPSLLAFDGNGRIYVAEMRTYMQDIDGTGAHEPVSRVSLLQDTDGDGQIDKHSVFIDGLVLPRMILTLEDSILVRETNTLDLHEYRDTDGDGVADEKTLVFEGGKRGGNLEHQPSGLDWNIDNHLYVTYTSRRYSYRNGKVTAHKLAAGDGQWGMTHDDWGQCFYSRAGGEVVASNFQQNMQYGKLSVPGEFEQDFEICWPIDDVPDVQGGKRRVRDDNTLNHFTGCCGQVVYRGDRLPADLYGNLFVPEPVGRLIRRATVADEGGKRVLRNAHPGSEFLRTKDANFRPINMYTAPDGTLYIVDMYRGIIQEGNWVREGSYLRGVVQEYGLDQNIGRGRIYRLVHDDFERGAQPRMLEETSEQLVAHLAHPNGWWRDTAQKLLVLRGDTDAVTPLRRMLVSHSSPVARNHAMWTLHGMGRLRVVDLIVRLKDQAPEVRASAVRASESFLPEAKNRRLVKAVRAAAADADARVVLQVLRTLLYCKVVGHEADVDAIVAAHADNDAIEHTAKKYYDRLAKEQAEAERRAEIARANAALAAAVGRGADIYQTLCFTCHGNDGEGMPVPGGNGGRLAPSLQGSLRVLGSPHRLGRIVLQGLAGPVDGKTYPGEMAPMAANDDAWVADVMTFVRNSWGNEADQITKADVAKLRTELQPRKKPWTLKELQTLDPVVLARSDWKLTSNRGAKQLRRAVDGKADTRWSCGRPQKPGTFVQIELPEAVEVFGVRLDTAGSADDFPVGYEVHVSLDGSSWGDAVATGAGKKKLPVIRWDPAPARFVRITQTGKSGNWYWSVHELELFGQGNPLPK